MTVVELSSACRDRILYEHRYSLLTDLSHYEE
jgi:hypothetical protein